jgi:hypothetical protein
MTTPLAVIPLCLAHEDLTKHYLERSMHLPVEVMAWMPFSAGARAPYEPRKPEALPRRVRAMVTTPPANRYATVRIALHGTRRRGAMSRELENLAKDRGVVECVGSHFGPPVSRKRTTTVCFNLPTKKHAPRQAPRPFDAASAASPPDDHAATLPRVGDPSGTCERCDVLMSDAEVLEDDRRSPVWPCLFDDDA